MVIIKKAVPLILIYLLYGFTVFAQVPSDESDAIIGMWLMPDNEGILEVFKENNKYQGKIVWLKKTEEDGSPLKDKKNPDEKLRNRKVIGLQVMNGFNYEGENIWSGGTFYAARKGRVAEPELILVNDNQLNVKISIFIFSKTITFTRVDTAKFFKEMNIVNE